MTAEAAQELEVTIPVELAGRRLDQALTELLTGRSRAQVQKWIREGRARIDGRPLRPRDKVAGGERVIVSVPAPEPAAWQAEPIPLEVVHEDADILVVNKPPGLVVHPGAGNREGTLLNALLAHAPELAALPRAGIVHRLDKETSGIMVVARTERAPL
jgi:23S rRNA pseudouridine1911/1915/1917 synthase